MLLFISDGIKDMVAAIEEIYLGAKYQTCCVHISRNLAHKVRVADRAEICEDFNTVVYRARNEQAGREALEHFCEIWNFA